MKKISTTLQDEELISKVGGDHNFLNNINLGIPQAFGVGNIANLGNHNTNVMLGGGGAGPYSTARPMDEGTALVGITGIVGGTVSNLAFLSLFS